HEAIASCMQHLGIGFELPPATADEMAMARSNPGLAQSPSRPPTRTPSQPTPSPSAKARATPIAAARPTPLPAAAPVPTPAPLPAPQKSYGAIIAAVATLLVVALGGIGYLVYDSNRRQARLDEDMRRAAQVAREEADRKTKLAQEAEKAQPTPPQTVTLFVVSEPLGAEVEATWKDGKKQGVTAFNFEVPKGTAIHFQFRKPGFVPNPYESDVFADGARTVQARLTPEPKVIAASPVAPKKPKKDRPPKEGEDETIKIDV